MDVLTGRWTSSTGGGVEDVIDLTREPAGTDDRTGTAGKAQVAPTDTPVIDLT
jgi:hypothetical protein